MQSAFKMIKIKYFNPSQIFHKLQKRVWLEFDFNILYTCKPFFLQGNKNYTKR